LFFGGFPGKFRGTGDAHETAARQPFFARLEVPVISAFRSGRFMVHGMVLLGGVVFFAVGACRLEPVHLEISVDASSTSGPPALDGGSRIDPQPAGSPIDPQPVGSPVDAQPADRAPARDGDSPTVAGADGSSTAAGPDAPPSGPSTVAACSNTDQPIVRLQGTLTTNLETVCDRRYLLVGTVTVRTGVTITVAPGTVIQGDSATKGALVVQPGGQLRARGTAERPILFTSSLAPEVRQAGDWGGVVMLGRAPTNRQRRANGGTAGADYGGTDENDSSGVLQFVRIEYGGGTSDGDETISGLTLGGVGRGTTIDHVQVRQTSGACFEFAGGTANATYLVCQGNRGTGFDWHEGYRGNLQFLVVQMDPASNTESNAFAIDNNNGPGRPPTTEPTIFNATLCGRNRTSAQETYGILVRRSARVRVRNALVTGFHAGVDVRDLAPAIDVMSSVFWGQLANAIAFDENGGNGTTLRDDDGGFDEVRAVTAAARQNSTATPLAGDCFNRNQLALAPPRALPEAAIALNRSPFFDARATYIGAFRDTEDLWATGPWVVWADR
jgi:hypothetical protein